MRTMFYATSIAKRYIFLNLSLTYLSDIVGNDTVRYHDSLPETILHVNAPPYPARTGAFVSRVSFRIEQKIHIFPRAGFFYAEIVLCVVVTLPSLKFFVIFHAASGTVFNIHLADIDAVFCLLPNCCIQVTQLYVVISGAVCKLCTGSVFVHWTLARVYIPWNLTL